MQNPVNQIYIQKVVTSNIPFGRFWRMLIRDFNNRISIAKIAPRKGLENVTGSI